MRVSTGTQGCAILLRKQVSKASIAKIVAASLPPFTALSRQGGYAHILKGYFYTNLGGTLIYRNAATPGRAVHGQTAHGRHPDALLMVDPDSRTTKLYDRRGQKVLLEDMERCGIKCWKGRWVLVVTGIILTLNVAQLIMARHFHAV